MPRFLARLFAFFAAALMLSVSAQADDSVIRIGYQKFNTLNILKGTGNLERALKPLGIQVKWHEFAAGPQLLEALNARAVDFGHAADAPTVFAQVAGIDLVYLAAEHPYPKGIALLVPADSPIRSVRELKGQKIAIGRGWNVQYLLVRALEQAGLRYEDIQPVYATNAADARAAFESGQVQAIGLWDPYLAGQQLSSKVRVLRDGSGLSSNRTFYVASRSYAGSHKEVLRRVFAELKKSEQWAQQHPQAVADLLAPQLGVDARVLKLATERRDYQVQPVDARIVQEQQQLADTFNQLGLTPRKIRVQDAVFTESLL